MCVSTLSGLSEVELKEVEYWFVGVDLEFLGKDAGQLVVEILDV